MAFFDFLKPKWKRGKWQERRAEIAKGKLSQGTLTKIIKDHKESREVQKEAINQIKNETLLASLVFAGGRHIHSELIASINSLELLQDLLAHAEDLNDTSAINDLEKRIEDLEIKSLPLKSDQELMAALNCDKSWSYHKAAMEHIQSAPLFGKWLSAQFEGAKKDNAYLMIGAKEAIKRFGLDKLLKEVNSLKLLNVLANEFYTKTDIELIANRVRELNKNIEYIKRFGSGNDKIVTLLLPHIQDQKTIIALIDKFEKPHLKLKAYALAADEVRANRKHLAAMIHIIQNSKNRIDADVEALLNSMGQKLIYRMTETRDSIKCDICNGTGRMPYCDHGDKCDACGGSGTDGYTTREVIESIVVN